MKLALIWKLNSLIKEWHFTCVNWEAASTEWVVEPSGVSDTLEEAGALLKGTAKGIIIYPSSDTPKNLRGQQKLIAVAPCSARAFPGF